MQKRKSQMGKKTGSVINDPIDMPAGKNKGKKPKKQSKGKQKH